MALAPNTSIGSAAAGTARSPRARSRAIPEVVDLEAGGVDDAGPLREQDPGCDRADVVFAGCDSQHLREGVDIDQAVVVHERDPLAAGEAQPGRHGARVAERGAAVQHDRAPGRAASEAESSLRTTISSLSPSTAASAASSRDRQPASSAGLPKPTTIAETRTTVLDRPDLVGAIDVDDLVGLADGDHPAVLEQ